jgi:hypothetical protein
MISRSYSAHDEGTAKNDKIFVELNLNSLKFMATG